MSILEAPITWQNQLIPSENNLARSCVDRIANHVENGGRASGLQTRILTVSSPVIFFIGSMQSGVKFACHLGLAISGQSHQLKQSTIELIKMIGATVLSVLLFIPTTFSPTGYRFTNRLFELNTKRSETVPLAFNGKEKTCGSFGDFIHPKNSVTLSFKSEALNHRFALLRQIRDQADLRYDRLVIDGSECLELIKNNANLFSQAAVVVIKNVEVNNIDWLDSQFKNTACFDFRGSHLRCDLKKLKEKHIVVTDNSSNLAKHFNDLSVVDLKSEQHTENPVAKLIKKVDLGGKNYDDDDIKKISRNLKKLFPKINYLVLDKNTLMTEQVFNDLAESELTSITFKGCPEIGKDFDAFEKGLKVLVNDQLRYLIFDGLGPEYRNCIEGIKKKHTQLKVVYDKSLSRKRRVRSGSVTRRRASSVA